MLTKVTGVIEEKQPTLPVKYILLEVAKDQLARSGVLTAANALLIFSTTQPPVADKQTRRTEVSSRERSMK